jgi:hypothetical protein
MPQSIDFVDETDRSHSLDVMVDRWCHGGMIAAGNTKITDLLEVTPPRIPSGAHAMTQLVEVPPADAGLAPVHRGVYLRARR